MSAASTLGPKTVLGGPGQLGESRVRFRASWDLYESLSRELGDQRVLLAYDGEYIELMSPGFHHERFKSRVHHLVLILVDLLGLDYACLGSTRWKSSQALRGLEADEAYYFTTEKIAQSASLPWDAKDFPIPDLALEIDLSPSQVDRPSIYSALGVPEVWRLDRGSFVIESRDADGHYQPVEASRFLRITSEELDQWIMGQPLLSDKEFVAEITAWARERFANEP